MPLSYAELEQFYEGLIAQAHSQGITCAITSGMACVTFGVAQATQDCDLLCGSEHALRFLKLLSKTSLHGALPDYRGPLSPPLDARWLRGGWTSHFVWNLPEGGAYLDVFGIAPRATNPWETERKGFYASPHTVAEMKRTNREKDWPYTTALGVKLLEAGDARGWLHIFNYEVLMQTGEKLMCPAEMIALRPVLGLLAEKDERLELALRGEVEFWSRLDRLRIRIYEQALRSYALAVKEDPRAGTQSLMEQHEVRVEKAERLLAPNPLGQYGIERLILEAKTQAARFLPSGALDWLPDVLGCFRFLSG